MWRKVQVGANRSKWILWHWSWFLHQINNNLGRKEQSIILSIWIVLPVRSDSIKEKRVHLPSPSLHFYTLLLTQVLPGGEPSSHTCLSSTHLVVQCHGWPSPLPPSPVPLSVFPGSSPQIKSLSEKSMPCSPNDAKRTGGVRQKVIRRSQEAIFYPLKYFFFHLA